MVMRFTDTFGPWEAGHFGEYELAAIVVAKITQTNKGDWRVISDSHQISTREAGKSGCAFLAYNFKALPSAVVALGRIASQLPKVNVELHLSPDGYYDQGDGPSSYQHQPHWQVSSRYIPERGFSCSLLVDAQNIMRD